MGYHNNEVTTKQAIADAQRFINDRARLEFALRTTLAALGVGPEQRDKIVSGVKDCEFSELYKTIRPLVEEKDCG